MIQLRPYQQAAIDSVLGYWAQGGGNPLVDLATGLGKSVVVAKITRDVIERYPDMRVLMLVHVKELVEQNFMALLRLWPDAHAGIYSAGLNRRDAHRQIVFASIQSVFKKARELGPRDLVLIDEAHLVPKDGDGMYRTLLEGLRYERPDMRVAGFTATPYRLNGGRLDEGDNQLFDETVYSYGIGAGIKDGWLSPLRSKAGETTIDVSGVAKSGGEFVGRALEAAVDTDDITAGAVREILRFGEHRRSWLVFCAGVGHAHHVRDALRAVGVTCETITGDTPSGDRARYISEFKAGRIRCLTNANVLTTGFDAPSVDLVAMLRPTMSPGLYCLDAETEILTSKGWKGIGAVYPGDVALAMNLTIGHGEWSSVLATVRRPMLSEEQWVEYQAPRANFRVTGDHRLIISTKDRSGRTSWRLQTAIEAASFRDGIYMPTAVKVPSVGVPLTEDELYLIGVIMTDGSISTHQVTIYQSERHPEIIARIESALNRAGISWKKARAYPNGSFIERHARWRYSISAGDPRGGRSGKGIRYLYPFLDKDLAPALFQISRRQFQFLLSGMWDGDGYKMKSPSIDWIPRGLKISTARKTTADRLQALAVMHGYTCHLRWEHAHRKNPIAIMSFNDQDWRSVGGSGDRPKICTYPATNEEVWCVETEAGTIVTRRRGKVTVMGNCQMVGRGTRLAEGKDNCLILDFAGNVRRHGPVDVVDGGRKPGGTGNGGEPGAAPVKTCPECQALVPISIMACDQCDYVWPAREEPAHEATADNETPIISAEYVRPVHNEVRRWDAHLHEKLESPTSLRVEYSVGLQIHKEWICFEHTGYARAKAEKWWRLHGGLEPVPSTSKEAMYRFGELRQPVAIGTRPNGKWTEIVNRVFEGRAA